MINFNWRTEPSTVTYPSVFYSQNFSVAWLNWELNKQEERLNQKTKRIKK